MKRVGDVVRVAQGLAVVRCPDADHPDIGTAVLDENLDERGRVVDVFGPVERPYVSVSPEDGVHLASLVGATLYERLHQRVVTLKRVPTERTYMEQRTRAYAAGAAIVVIFLLVQLGALALVEPFKEAGLQAVEDPQNPSNSLMYVGAILLATGFMLVAIRYDVQWVLRAVIVASGAFLALYVFRVVIPPVVTLTVGGDSVHALAVGAAVIFAVALFVHPEWYVIDATGVVMGASAAGLFGISFGLLPAILLLTVLAVYDAISVYGTEHMLTLASGVMELKVPVVLVVPLSLSYSFLTAEMPDPTDDGEKAEAGESDPALANGGDQESEPDTDDAEADHGDPMDRDALFIGLGDAVIPTVLVASAAFFAPAGVPEVAGVAVPALTASVGTFAGLVVLIRMVLKGRAHAGLPLLNGGTIAGYLVGALASGIGLVQALGLGPYL